MKVRLSRRCMGGLTAVKTSFGLIAYCQDIIRPLGVNWLAS